MTPDIHTFIYDLPTDIYSFVRENPDGSYTIIINARLSYEDRARRYKHEIGHIENHDFEKDMTADEIEVMAHRRQT